MYISSRHNPNYVKVDEWSDPARVLVPSPTLRRVGTDPDLLLSPFMQIVKREFEPLQNFKNRINLACKTRETQLSNEMSKIYHIGDGKLMPYETFLENVNEFDKNLDKTIVDLQAWQQQFQNIIISIGEVKDNISNNLIAAKLNYSLQDQTRVIEKQRYEEQGISLDQLTPDKHTLITGNANVRGGQTKRRRKHQTKTRRNNKQRSKR